MGSTDDPSVLARQSVPEVGERWRTIYTGREDTVLKVGPCDVLDGETRVWLVKDEQMAKSNGWSLEHFYRCWEHLDG